MKLTELLGLDVEDSGGDRLGFVADLRLVQDAPAIGPYGAAFRVDGLILVERRHVRLLGYERDVGPWLLRQAVRRLSGQVRYVPWADVVSVEELVRLRVASEAVRHLHELPSRTDTATG